MIRTFAKLSDWDKVTLIEILNRAIKAGTIYEKSGKMLSEKLSVATSVHMRYNTKKQSKPKLWG